MPIARAALRTHPEPQASATAGTGLQTPRRAAYLQSAAAVSIFAGDRVRRGNEHPGRWTRPSMRSLNTTKLHKLVALIPAGCGIN